MATAKIVNVTPLPGGAGELHFDDGRPPLPVTPEIAEEQRHKLASQATPADIYGNPQRPAAPPSGLEKAAGEAWKKATTPAAAPADYDRGTPSAAPAEQLPPGARVASPEEWSAMPHPQAAPAPQQGPPASIAADQGAPPEAEPIDPNVALAQAIIARKEAGAGGGGPAHMAPVSEKTEFTRGTPYDIQQARDRLAADDAVKRAAFAEMGAEKAQADAQAAAAAAQIPKLQLEQARAQHDVDQREKDYRIQRAGLETELDNYDKSAEVDPRRFFSGDHAVSGMLSVVGAGLGAAGATLGRTQNWAFESMQKQIQQDIDAQVQAINSGHATRATALKRFVDYYHGDMDKAQTALAIAMNKAVTTEAMRYAAQSKSADIANNAASFSALFDQNSQKREQDLYNASLGTSKTEQTSKMQGGPGSGGPKTSLDDVLKLMKIQAAAGKGEKPTAGEVRVANVYNTKKEQIERNYSALNEMARLMGLKIDRATGTVIDPKTGRPATEPGQSPGVGTVAGHLPNAVVGVEGRALRRARMNAARLHAATIYDKSITAQEAEHEMPSIMGTQESDLVPSLQQQLEELHEYDSKLDAGAAAINPRIVNQRDQATKNVNRARAYGKPLAERPGYGGGDTPADDAEANTSD